MGGSRSDSRTYMSEGRFLTLATLAHFFVGWARKISHWPSLHSAGPAQEVQNDRSQSFMGQTTSIFLCGSYNMMLRVCLGTFNAYICCVFLPFSLVHAVQSMKLYF